MRKEWGQLSGSYRSRLERGGVTRSAYESGVSLSAARGHARTPERPERAYTSQGRYQDYLNRRAALERDVIARKKELFSDSPKWNVKRSARTVHEGPTTGKAPSMAKMQRFLDTSYDELYDQIVDDGPDEWDFLYYH